MEITAEVPNTRARNRGSLGRRAFVVLICGVLPLLILSSTPAYAAAGDITTVIDSIRNWVAGILAALATLFLTVGGVRYLIANGNPRAMEEGKAAIKSALMGYALAALAPMFVDILRRVLVAG